MGQLVRSRSSGTRRVQQAPRRRLLPVGLRRPHQIGRRPRLRRHPTSRRRPPQRRPTPPGQQTPRPTPPLPHHRTALQRNPRLAPTHHRPARRLTTRGRGVSRTTRLARACQDELPGHSPTDSRITPTVAQVGLQRYAHSASLHRGSNIKFRMSSSTSGRATRPRLQFVDPSARE